MRILAWLVCGALIGCGGSSTSDGAGGASGSGGSGTGAVAGTGGSGAGGGTGASGGTGATGATGGTGASGGSGKNSGDCDDDTDCAGGKCVELTPGGYRVCVSPVDEATACQNQSLGVDECCNSSECTTGKCYAFPATPQCFGPQPIDHNVCALDGCELGKLCPVGNEGQGVCMPGGAYGYKVSGCVGGGCEKDTDCTGEPGAICAPIEDACCSAPTGFFCVYPSDGCRKQSDCGQNEYCGTDYDATKGEWMAHCKPGPVGCPA